MRRRRPWGPLDLVRVALVVLLTLGACLLPGCGPGYPTPFTAQDMARMGTGKALVHYLGQPGATAAVCDRKSAGPHFQSSSPEDLGRLADALVDGDVRPDLWRRCAMILLESAPPSESAPLLDAMAHDYRRLLGQGAVETDKDRQAEVEAVHQTFLLRPRGTAPHDEAVAGDLGKLRDALAKGRLGPIAARYGRELLATVDLDRGLWHGAPLDVAALDALAQQKDETQLRRIELRVLDPALQNEARRRIVRLHVAASPSAYVRDHIEDVEAVVLSTGRDALDLTKHAPSAAWLDESKARVRGVLVRQDVWKQTVTLLAYEGEQPGASILPSLDLRGALFARVDGLKEPVTLCAPPDALDVTPCVLPSELHPKVPIVFVDAEGLLHFVERVTSRDAMRLVYNTPNLPLPFTIGGKPLLTIEWPIVFESPGPLVFSGPTSGRGPDLRVVVERRYGPRLLFEIAAPGGQIVGAVEAADLDRFEIASRGGSGTAGSRGMDGSSGSSGSAGSPASCPGSPGGNGGNGSPGGNGTSGGPGGPGGPGGDVIVHVVCATGECGSVSGRAERMVRSEGGSGGPGGEGGQGGAGGAGGPGGSGASCTDSQGHFVSVPGGTSGMPGSRGSSGSHGSNGANGAPGHVQIRASG